MNNDIRLSVGFKSHRKRIKLKRLLGAEGVLALVDLWLSVAATRPDGKLTGWAEEDIAIEAQYEGDAQQFVAALEQVGFLEKTESGTFHIHNWNDNQPWASRSLLRSIAGKRNALLRWGQKEIPKDQRQDFRSWFEAHYIFAPSDSGSDVAKAYSNYANGIVMASESHGNGIATAMQPHAIGNAPNPNPNPNPIPIPTLNNIVERPTVSRPPENPKEPTGFSDNPDKPKKATGLIGTPSNTKKPKIPYAEIIKFLNEEANVDFKAKTASTRKFIKARFNEEFSLEDFKLVISAKAGEWMTDPAMVSYLRPSTLFGTKFEGYLQHAKNQSQTFSKDCSNCDYQKRGDCEKSETERLECTSYEPYTGN